MPARADLGATGCNLSSYTFAAHDGRGTGQLLKAAGSQGCDVVNMRAADTNGMAASFMSPALQVLPGMRYNVTFSFKADHLVPIPGGPASGAASLTGSIYLHFFDVNQDPGAWNPQFGKLAPSDTMGRWQQGSTSFVVPTTARTVRVHVAFGAHTFTYSPNRMLGGRATGQVMIGDIRFVVDGPVTPLPSTIRVPEPTLQKALDQAFKCLHNSKQSGNFTVGAGYTISGNISPDLTFGLHGIRRTGHPSYVEQMSRQWQWHEPDPATGKYTAGRVMGQINWPLGVDQIFSFTGDLEYMSHQLPTMDASLAYVERHTDKLGLATLVPLGQGHMGGGTDWVDWFPKGRLDGRSFNFHQWWIRTLRRVAELHDEFSFGNKTLAKHYNEKADALHATLQSTFWLHAGWWRTNADYPDNGQWLDDTVWSVYHGVATANQTALLYDRINSNLTFFEGVPLRWSEFENAHWACSWFGRLGAGDIMARYKTGDAAGAFDRLQRIAGIIASQEDIYEGYDMTGCGLKRCGCTTSGFGDYLEHCGGLIWSVTEGMFGVNFDSNASAGTVATISPHFPHTWTSAAMSTRIRGIDVDIEWSAPEMTIAAGSAHADFKSVRVGVICGGGTSRAINVASNTRQTVVCS